MTTRDRRAAVLGAVVIVSAVLGLRVIPAGVRYLGTLRADLDERVLMVTRAQALVAGAPALSDSLREATAHFVTVAPQLLPGTSAADATAEFSAYLAVLAEQSGLQVRTLQPLPRASNEVFEAVAMRAELEGRVEALADFLRRVEDGTPLVVVRAITLRAAEPTQPGTASSVVQLDAEFVAWRLPREEDAS
jgi:Tfp pilus assembly protein PilO